MSIVIDRKRCTGCGKCIMVCPGGLIKKDNDGTAVMKYPRDCWGCASCIKECKLGAAALYLGAELGGMGAKMTVLEKGSFLIWSMEKADGAVEQIAVDKRESNQY